MIHKRPRRLARHGLSAALVLLLAACAGANVEHDYPSRGPGGRPTYDEPVSIFGEGGLSLFGNDSGEGDTGGSNAGIGVNSYLWRASLDTIAFMPLKSADPFGGVIITDWYVPPETADERFKINIFILDRTLRSDGVRVGVFRQTRRSDGVWIDAERDDQLDQQVENRVLTRARQLRIRTTGQLE